MRRSRFTLVVAVALLLAMAALGAVAYGLQCQRGDFVTGMRGIGGGGAVWGLYVVMDGCFLGVGVALMAVACLARFSRDPAMEAAARIAMPSAIACSLGAGLSIMADQGRPLAALMNLSRYARPQSPMFVTFTAVGAVCLFASLLHCVLARRPDLAEYAKRSSPWQALQRMFAAGYRGTPGQRYRRRKVGFWMSLSMLPALLAPATALSILFVVRAARTADLVLLEIVGFLTTSLAAGVGTLLVVAALVERLAGHEAGLGARGYRRLGRWLLLLVSLTLLAVVATEMLSLQSREPAVAAYGRALLHEYRAAFWGALVCWFVAAGLLLGAVHRRRRGVVWAGVLVAAAAFLHHYWLLLAWQTHGLALPYAAGAYAPTWIELAVVLGIVAFCLLLLLPAVRLIPFVPLAAESRADIPRMPDLRRTVLTSVWMVGALATVALGLVGSARAGTEPQMDPALPWSPVIFIVGLVLLASTSAVYELLPERE